MKDDAMITTTRKRTDVHRPAVMDPADYVWVGAFGDYADREMYYCEVDYERLVELGAYDGAERDDRVIADDLPWDALTERRACCHCGNTRIKNWRFFLHVPTRRVVAVGQECATKLALETREAISRRAEIQQRRIAAELAEWRAADERNERAYADLMAREDEAGGSGGAGNEFVDSLLRYARRNGRLSEAQRDAVLRGIETRERRAQERSERDERMGDPEPADVVEGRITITGRLLTTKSVEGWGGRSELKMLVLDDRGFRVWGTLPGAIVNAAYEQASREGYTGPNAGVQQALQQGMKCRVRFTATVERSRKDGTFGFYKRPTKAEVI
jgi:hypothetical protein